MDFDLFLTSPRWEILNIISKNPSSPIEIAEKLNTTVSYISQQLKLLDAAGLVIKKKTGAVLKGKPRMLFSLSNEFLYFASLTKDFSEKKLLNLTSHHKALLKIWFFSDISLHYSFGKLFWKLDEDIDEIVSIFLDISTNPKMIIVSDSKKLKLKIDSFVSKFSTKVDYSFVSNNQLKKCLENKLEILYDPNHLIEKVKGGGT